MPLGITTTPGLERLVARNASDFCLFSRDMRSNSTRACSIIRCWNESSRVRICSRETVGLRLA
ncbi:hypothetical protein D3C83_194440 [compost metagenome]